MTLTGTGETTMTEFERATIAFQEATITYQESTLAFQEATLAFQEAALVYQAVGLAIAAANTLAALAAAAGIWYGIRAMVRANKERAAILDQQREADERRHEETMTAMREHHEEAMRRLDHQGRALETLITGLETVIERTAPKG